MELNTILSGRLKDARQKKGYKQKELAERCGCKQAIISNAENGRSVPEIGTLIQIAQELEVSLDWLCGIEPKKKQGGEITSAQWLDYLARLLENPPVRKVIGVSSVDGSPEELLAPSIELEVAEDPFAGEAKLLFSGFCMNRFFKLFSALNSFIGFEFPDDVKSIKQTVINKYARCFVPGRDITKLFSESEDDDDDKIPFDKED